MLQVAFAGNFAAGIAPAVRRHLATPCEIIVGDETDLIPRLATVDVLVTLALTAEMARAARRLKLVQVPGAGLDRIDRAALPPGAMLANAYGHETGIAEYVLGAMLAMTRDLAGLDAALRRGAWPGQWQDNAEPLRLWPELAGKTLGIIGYGRIGQAVARRARAFDMTVRAIRRDIPQSMGDDLAVVGGPEILHALLKQADYVVIALPATPATVGLLGRRELDLMKPTSFLINVARGEIVDEDALYEALLQRRIAGAALDVWYRYPPGSGAVLPATRSFHELPNVLMTPHIAGATEGTVEARARLIAENIRRVAQGDTPLNLVGP